MSNDEPPQWVPVTGPLSRFHCRLHAGSESLVLWPGPHCQALGSGSLSSQSAFPVQSQKKATRSLSTTAQPERGSCDLLCLFAQVVSSLALLVEKVSIGERGHSSCGDIHRGHVTRTTASCPSLGRVRTLRPADSCLCDGQCGLQVHTVKLLARRVSLARRYRCHHASGPSRWRRRHGCRPRQTWWPDIMHSAWFQRRRRRPLYCSRFNSGSKLQLVAAPAAERLPKSHWQYYCTVFKFVKTKLETIILVVRARSTCQWPIGQ